MNVLSVTKENREHYSQFFPEELRFFLYRDEVGFLGLIDMDENAGEGEGEAIPAGVCVYSARTEDAITIEWMYIDEEYQKKGYSQMLMEAVFTTAHLNGRFGIIAKMWTADPSDPDADSFLTEYGFVPMPSGYADKVYYISELKQDAIEKYGRGNAMIKRFSELPSAVISEQRRQMEASAGAFKDVDQEISRAIVEKGQVKASIIVRRLGDTCMPVMLYYDDGVEMSDRSLLICQILESIRERVGENGMLYLESEPYDAMDDFGMFFNDKADLTAVSYQASLDLKKKENKSYRTIKEEAAAYRRAVDSIPTDMVMIGLEEY